MTERPGYRFHEFVAMLERTLHRQEGVEVHSPMRLRDHDTGRLREHDIVIIRTTRHDRLMTAVECRDRGRKVTVPDRGIVREQMPTYGIHHGVIVAAHGFANTARQRRKRRISSSFVKCRYSTHKVSSSDTLHA